MSFCRKVLTVWIIVSKAIEPETRMVIEKIYESSDFINICTKVEDIICGIYLTKIIFTYKFIFVHTKWLQLLNSLGGYS